eukprot:TRINITY_DN227_c0_g1_i2.p1 TRINITY_DN227_c0_g1~~TRINITY_DN227_c0_g1_i2.p1  ORF type:complete len:431 (-),score=171.18 TRINITY_DN227_c0_g1_i2:48-1340(-)
MKQTIIAILFLFALSTNAIDWTGGSGIFAEVFGSGSITGEININSALSIFTVTIDAETTLDGTLNIGGGLLNFGPTLAIEALTTIGNLTMDAGEIIVAAGSKLVVTGDFAITASVDIVGDVEVQGKLVADSAVTFGSETAADGLVALSSSAEAAFGAAVTFYSNFKTAAKTTVSTSLTAHGSVEIEADASLKVEAGATANFNGDATIKGWFEGEGDVTFGGEADTSVMIEGEVQTANSFVFEGLAWAENSVDVILDAAVTVKGEAALEAKNQVNVTGDLVVEGSGHVVCTGGDILVQSKFALGASTTYAVNVASGVESEIKRVKCEGEAELDGTVELDISVELEAEVTIMEFSARGETEFSAVTVISASNKRGLMSTEETGEEEEDNDDYEINYGDKSVTVGPKGVSVDESTDTGATLALAVLSMLALFA